MLFMGLMRVRWGGAPSLDLSISQLAELNLINDTNSGVKHSVTGGSVKGKDSSSAFPDWYVLLGVLHSYLLHSSSPFPIGMCRCHDTCPLSSFQVSLFLSLQVSAAVSLGGSLARFLPHARFLRCLLYVPGGWLF